MRTTLDINDALLRELRQRAATAGRPFREIVDETPARGLASADKKSRTKGVRVRAQILGLKSGFRGVSLNQLHDQLEAESSARKP